MAEQPAQPNNNTNTSFLDYLQCMSWILNKEIKTVHSILGMIWHNYFVPCYNSLQISTDFMKANPITPIPLAFFFLKQFPSNTFLFSFRLVWKLQTEVVTTQRGSKFSFLTACIKNVFIFSLFHFWWTPYIYPLKNKKLFPFSHFIKSPIPQLQIPPPNLLLSFSAQLKQTHPLLQFM